MRERVSHRHRRITARITGQIKGRVAVCLLCLLAGAAHATLPAGAAHAQDQTGDTVIDHANQLFILGQNRESGEWVQPNPVEAYMWYLLAGMAGHDRAPTARERIAADMTVEQIAAAWSQAGRCLSTGYLYCDERTDP